MSAASSLRAEEDFLCSICLEVFTDPVSTSCGHTFCRSCLTLHWTAGDVVSCPMCKHIFTDKPELHVNIVIKEMVSQLRREDRQQPGGDSGGGDSGGGDSGGGDSGGGASAPEQRAAEGSVLCDLCTWTRLKAFKSCLVCLTSYCKTHLEPHGSRSALRRHQLVEPVDNLEGRLCPRHDKPLELFCQSDQACVCMLCSILEHKNHQLVPLRDEAESKKAELGKVEAELQQLIQRKQEKMEKIRKVVRSSKEAADEAKAEGVAVFTAVVQAAQEGLKRLGEDVDETRRAKEKVAEGLLEDLDQELCELLRKRSELQQLSQSEDHLHLLQSLPTLTTAAPAGREEVEDGVSAPLYEEMVTRAVARLEETVKTRREKLCESRLRKVQQYAVDVTLDPETVNPWLHLSEDRKQVHDEDVEKEFPENPKRLMDLISVLGEQSFSSGRFYFEVQVRRKTEWEIGVVVESFEREGHEELAPENGFWVLSLENKRKYQINDSPPVNLKLQSRPKRVGVFVDYDEGLVSFYDADTAALIHSFTGCSFTEKLFPFLGPGVIHGSLNSEPLVISSLNEIGEIYKLPDLFE